MVVKRPPKTEGLRPNGGAAQPQAIAGFAPPVVPGKPPTPKQRGRGWFPGMFLVTTIVLCTAGNVRIERRGRLRRQEQQQQEQQQQEQQQQQQHQNDWPGSAIEIPKYPLRDVSNYYKSKQSMIERAKSFGNLSNCLSYECTNDSTECDTFEPTDYNNNNHNNYNNYTSTGDIFKRKPKEQQQQQRRPPCCIHILRDMARVFDDEMSRLGLDYTAGFGTLLGLRRSDKLIPWTVDNDYILESRQVANAMIDLWNATSTGLSILYQGLPRMCATRDFAGGRLARWEVARATNYERSSNANYEDQLWNQGYPYMDFYVGSGRISRPRLHGGNPDQDGDKSSPKLYFWELKECLHRYDNVFPTKRIGVYGNSFAQNVPAHTDAILADKYGPGWKVPVAGTGGHGSRTCGPSEYWAIRRSDFLKTAGKWLGTLLLLLLLLAGSCLLLVRAERSRLGRATRSMGALLRAHVVG